jgi:hypothetical protein
MGVSRNYGNGNGSCKLGFTGQQNAQSMSWSFSHRLPEIAESVEASVVRLKFEKGKTQIQM